MPDRLSSDQRSRLMSRVRSFGNSSTEMAVARLLRHLQVSGWRRHVKIGLGKTPKGKSSSVRPDFVFSKRRIALFVHGCFWHGCPQHGTIPATRTVWWQQKISATIIRDRARIRELKIKGWSVLVIWEHEINTKSHYRIRNKLRRVGLLG
jgi:DNA mismatch endonuclease, patch repair protein